MTQERALTILKTGASVFLTGEPGAGKTYVINEYINWLERAGLSVAVTASTGIAATHIGGMTIHAWSGIGVRDTLSRYDLDQITARERVAKRIMKANVLIIDEISMLDGYVLDMVELVVRTVRQRNEPFGGLQVVCVGDFFQLPPIVKPGAMMRYAFESRAWHSLRPLTCYLHEQYRQEDELLLGLLGSIRRDAVEEDHYTLLREQTDISYEGIEPTRLYTHNADVDAVNNEKLAALSGSGKTFTMLGKGSKVVREMLIKNCLSPQVLTLKEDAMVMCTKNNFEAGYVNGTLARVVGFAEDGYPIIETKDARQITVRPASWEVAEEGKVLAAIEQLPLRLAWAITVHKSQGMSLDAAEIDLSRAFVYGQGYVALSRVRSLSGLKILGLGPNALQVDPKIVAKDAHFRTESAAADETFAALPADEIETMHRQFVTALGGTIPDPSDTASPPPGSRLQKESSFVATGELLRAGRTIGEIAKERQLAESTIWTHLEKLAATGKLAEADVAHLAKGASWAQAKERITSAIQTHGSEKLKPLYEATNEAYDYATIRLARLCYWLENGIRPAFEKDKSDF